MSSIARVYNTAFNYFFLLVSLVMVGFSVYFLIDNNSDLAKVVAGISAVYLLVALSGIVSRFLNFGYFIFLALLVLITLFQAAVFVLITFFKTDSLKRLREMDGGDYSAALTCYDFIRDNTLVIQIAIGALTVIYFGAFLAAYALKIYKPRRYRRDTNEDNV